ncbi:hypothetical protein [Sphingomonas phyllosphaerae]|uniref:hypothetical protein n=1 Tax=Sphingomonas phyllosphaerae TaxID=257003 RepID=UPI0024131B94|nr:hypothetical protein [Sphingomonas phyllosphaerae]
MRSVAFALAIQRGVVQIVTVRRPPKQPRRAARAALPFERRAATIWLPLSRILVYPNTMNEVAPSSSLPAHRAGARLRRG